MKYTFEKLIKEVLEKSDIPLTASEIWQSACELKISDKVSSSGKTPWKTIEAKIYVDLKKHRESDSNSEFVKVSARPAKFGLSKKTYFTKFIPKQVDENSNNFSYNERDLHPLLVKFVFSDEHFKSCVKTIFHEKSNRRRKGKNKWLHPDIVGVHFPFDDFNEKTLGIIKSLNESAVKFYSFEIKKEIDFNNLRESFFQTVSNSSWANEGYLVAVKYSDESEFTDEMQRLNNSFGIGFIKLNIAHIEQSEILLPAKAKEKIDWETVNRLVEENEDFKDFILHVSQDISVSDIRGTYDKVLDDSEYEKYLKQKNICAGEK